MTANDAIMQFSGEYRFLSNFFPATVELDGALYPTVENAYQAAKRLPDVRTEFQTALPGQAKRLGRQTRLPPDWEARKLDVMADLLVQKFQHQHLKDALLKTGERLLCEGNTWGDTFWGVDLKTLEGSNHLGELLMLIRKCMRAFPRAFK